MSDTHGATARPERSATPKVPPAILEQWSQILLDVVLAREEQAARRRRAEQLAESSPPVEEEA